MLDITLINPILARQYMDTSGNQAAIEDEMTARMSYHLHCIQIVPGGLLEVFDFFKDPRNLELITPPWLSFRVVGASDSEVRRGTRIRYRFRWQMFSMRWESRITEFEENRLFADEMLSGPYRRWYHRHSFRTAPGGVEVRDHVEYALPLGPLGRLAHALAVRRQLEGIFGYRRDRIAALFGAARPDIGANSTGARTCRSPRLRAHRPPSSR